MRPILLAKRSIIICFDWYLASKIAPYFIIMVAILRFENNRLLTFVEYLLAPIFTVILINILNSYIENLSLRLPNYQEILKKSVKVFSTSVVTGLLIFLGLIFFIAPGIILMKRYIYAIIISAEEDKWPIQSLKKSRILSESNVL